MPYLLSPGARRLALIAAILLVPLPAAAPLAFVSTAESPTCARFIVRDVGVVEVSGGSTPNSQTQVAATQSRGADTVSPCDTPDTPSFVSDGEEVDSLVADVDEEDWFAFRAFCGETITATASPEAGLAVRISIHEPTAPYAEVAASTSASGAPASVAYEADVSGEWRIRVSAGDTGTYALKVTPSGASPDAGTGEDASPSQPGQLAVPGCSVNSHPEGDLGDAFRFQLEDGTAQVHVLPSRSEEIRIVITDPLGQPRAEGSVGAVGRTFNLTGPPGVWTILTQSGGIVQAGLTPVRETLYGVHMCEPMCHVE